VAALAMVPTAQSVQAAAEVPATAEEAVPAGQDMQVASVAALYLPAPQLSQVALASAARVKVPASHATAQAFDANL
jgi:hypothetical protein